MMESNGYSLSDIAAATGNGNNNGWGGDGAWWIILFLIFAAFGGGWGNGFGWGGGSGGIQENYVLTSDFATVQRQLSDGFAGVEKGIDTIRNGLCDGFYTTAQQINGVNTNILQGTNTLQGAIKDCCCQTQQNIADVKYTIGSTGASIQNQIQSCCCDVERQIERGFADTNYAMATQNCATLQAIDKVGDRIIDRLTQDKLDTLTNENQALRLAASQQAQNNYLVDKLGYHMPVAAYQVPNPFCNCNNGCGCA